MPGPIKGIAPLTLIEGLTPAQIQALGKDWIISIQDFLGIAAVAGGRAHLCDVLGVEESKLDRLLEQARDKAPRASKKEEEAMAADYATGAVEDERERERADETFDAIPFSGDLPASVDYIQRLPPPRNQGTRGTCVAHAAAAVREFMEIQAGAAEPSQINLSEQFIYWWCKQQDNLPNVSGTYPHLGLKCLDALGTTLEEQWPYNMRPRLGDEGQDAPPPEVLSEASRYRLKRMFTLNPKSVVSIKTALAAGKAVAFAIPVFDSWYRNSVTRTQGKINMPLPGERSNGAHAMALVGFVDDGAAPGGGYFLLRNSWSPWAANGPWGGGYGSIPYQFIAEHNMSATTGDRASQSDVYLRVAEGDAGQTPRSTGFNSPDIWVRHTADAQAEHQAPQAGQPNWLYLRAWNAGPASARGVKAQVFAAPASTSIWPHHWQAIGQIDFAEIAVGNAAVASLLWTPSTSGPWCLLARLDSPDDPAQYAWSARSDNNVAQKNLILLSLRPGAKAEFTFAMYGQPDQVTLMELDVDRRAFPRGRVELRMAERTGYRDRGRLEEDDAKLAKLAAEATDAETIAVGITADAAAAAGEQGEVIFTQRSGRLLVGRLVVQIKIV